MTEEQYPLNHPLNPVFFKMYIVQMEYDEKEAEERTGLDWHDIPLSVRQHYRREGFFKVCNQLGVSYDNARQFIDEALAGIFD